MTFYRSEKYDLQDLLTQAQKSIDELQAIKPWPLLLKVLVSTPHLNNHSTAGRRGVDQSLADRPQKSTKPNGFDVINNLVDIRCGGGVVCCLRCVVGASCVARYDDRQ